MHALGGVTNTGYRSHDTAGTYTVCGSLPKAGARERAEDHREATDAPRHPHAYTSGVTSI